MAATTWKPSGDDYVEALRHQNPWHTLGKVPESLAKPVRRSLAEELWKTIIHTPHRYQVVLGPRRVGKTVAMHQTIARLLEHGVPAKNLWFMRMDHPLFQDYTLGGWVRLLLNTVDSVSATSPVYLFLDEVNYATQWDQWLKTFYDEQWPIRLVATSSSTAALRNRTVESGVGRWSEQYLTPYSFAEYLDLRKSPGAKVESEEDLFDTRRRDIQRLEEVHIDAAENLFETIANTIAIARRLPDLASERSRFLIVGGFPELLLASEGSGEDDHSAMLRSQSILRSEAVQRVAGMDLPQVFDIKNPLLLERLLYVLGGQVCGLVNETRLANTIDLSRQTIHQYISYLEKAFLIFLLPNYSTREESVQRKRRKVYFVDGAVRNAALQRGLSPLNDPEERGSLIENAAAAHLYSLSLQSGRKLYHWRDKGHEVDLVFDDSAGPIAFEITSSRRHPMGAIQRLMSKRPAFSGRCFLVSSAISTAVLPGESEDGVGRMPFDAFLLAVSAQTHRALQNRLHLLG